MCEFSVYFTVFALTNKVFICFYAFVVKTNASKKVHNTHKYPGSDNQENIIPYLDLRSDSGITSPFTPRSGSGTPSLPDEGEFPCPQCEKRFGNRRNLMSHMRRHTGAKFIQYDMKDIEQKKGMHWRKTEHAKQICNTVALFAKKHRNISFLGDYKLFCEDCGKGFFTQSKLDSHKRKHTGYFQNMQENSRPSNGLYLPQHFIARSSSVCGLRIASFQ